MYQVKGRSPFLPSGPRPLGGSSLVAVVPARPLSRRRSCRGLPAWRPPGAAFLRPSGARCVCPGGCGRLAGVAALGGPGAKGAPGPVAPPLPSSFPQWRGLLGASGGLSSPSLPSTPARRLARPWRALKAPTNSKKTHVRCTRVKMNRTFVLFSLKFVLVVSSVQFKGILFFLERKKRTKKKSFNPTRRGGRGSGQVCPEPGIQCGAKTHSRQGRVVFFSARGTGEAEKNLHPTLDGLQRWRRYAIGIMHKSVSSKTVHNAKPFNFLVFVK